MFMSLNTFSVLSRNESCTYYYIIYNNNMQLRVCCLMKCFDSALKILQKLATVDLVFFWPSSSVIRAFTLRVCLHQFVHFFISLGGNFYLQHSGELINLPGMSLNKTIQLFHPTLIYTFLGSNNST